MAHLSYDNPIILPNSHIKNAKSSLSLSVPFHLYKDW